jgi:hypothetical protein
MSGRFVIRWSGILKRRTFDADKQTVERKGPAYEKIMLLRPFYCMGNVDSNSGTGHGQLGGCKRVREQRALFRKRQRKDGCLASI